MPYAEAVVREVLRLFPPATLGFRQTLVDLDICGSYVPEGSILYLSHYGAHMTDRRLLQSEPGNVVAQLERMAGSASSAEQDVTVPVHMDDSAIRAAFRPERWLGQGSKPSGGEGFANDC